MDRYRANRENTGQFKESKNLMNSKSIVVLAKERYGLNEALRFLKSNFKYVQLFKGARGDDFPKELYDKRCDICVSYISPWIIPERFLSAVREFSINFHPAPPEYRGIGCTNFAIYNNESRYGVTAHLMDSKVDSGRIIDVRRFPILPDDSLVSLTQKCYRHILEQFYAVFSHYLKHGNLPVVDERWSKHLYTRKELDELCKIQEGMVSDEIKRRVKATNFPDMPKAYVDMAGYRFEYKE